MLLLLLLQLLLSSSSSSSSLFLETLRFKTATRDDDLVQTNDLAEILSHTINCMNLEQFEEVEIRIFLVEKIPTSLLTQFQTERGRRLNLLWDFNYSLVFLIIMNCIVFIAVVVPVVKHVPVVNTATYLFSISVL